MLSVLIMSFSINFSQSWFGYFPSIRSVFQTRYNSKEIGLARIPPFEIIRASILQSNPPRQGNSIQLAKNLAILVLDTIVLFRTKNKPMRSNSSSRHTTKTNPRKGKCIIPLDRQPRIRIEALHQHARNKSCNTKTTRSITVFVRETSIFIKTKVPSFLS